MSQPIESPPLPFKIRLVGGRTMLVLELDPYDDLCNTKQQLYSVGDLRCWTHNGETICEDVLRTLIAGAEEVIPYTREV